MCGSESADTAADNGDTSEVVRGRIHGRSFLVGVV
jgi:hypothetical protein